MSLDCHAQSLRNHNMNPFLLPTAILLLLLEWAI
nr:MAG TPA: hypothetical protein [Bacteriophage sp.]